MHISIFALMFSHLHSRSRPLNGTIRVGQVVKSRGSAKHTIINLCAWKWKKRQDESELNLSKIMRCNPLFCSPKAV